MAHERSQSLVLGTAYNHINFAVGETVTAEMITRKAYRAYNALRSLDMINTCDVNMHQVIQSLLYQYNHWIDSGYVIK